MRKVKSILALLLLGTLTMAGCDLKKDDGNTPSEGGGGSGGGGDSGGGTIVTEPFKNKKIVFDSLTITPAQSPEVTEEYTASVRGQYVQFFEEGDFETVASNGEHTVVMFGTFTLSADKLTATATVKGAKTKEGTTPYPEEYWEEASFDYSATTSKYHVASKIPGPSAEDELTIDSFYVASQEAPQHYVFPQEQKVNITFNANGGEGSMQGVKVTSGGSYTLPSGDAVLFTREGYEFAGWMLTADGTEVVTALNNVTADTTVYAKWTEKAPESGLVAKFSLMGIGGDWETGIKGVDATDPEEVAEHQYAEQIKFEFAVEADPVEVKAVGGEVYLGYGDLGDGCKGLASAGENDNIRIEAAGDYTLFLKQYEDDTYGLWLVKAEPFALNVTSGTIEVGGHFVVTASGVTGELSYEVTEGSAEVNIAANSATITSSTEGTVKIAFSDDSEAAPIEFILTVNPVSEKTRIYVETKSWFNSGAENERVYVYAFKEGSDPIVQNAAFPGEETTWVKDIEDGKKIFTIELSKDYDTFVVSKVVDGSKVYQTVNILISAMGENNCVYLDAESGSDAIPVGYYTFTPDAA